MEQLWSVPVYEACAMCLGGADGELAIAANTAIGLMLSVLVVVLGSFGGFIFYLARKSKRLAAEEGTENG